MNKVALSTLAIFAASVAVNALDVPIDGPLSPVAFDISNPNNPSGGVSFGGGLASPASISIPATLWDPADNPGFFITAISYELTVSTYVEWALNGAAGSNPYNFTWTVRVTGKNNAPSFPNQTWTTTLGPNIVGAYEVAGAGTSGVSPIQDRTYSGTIAPGDFAAYMGPGTQTFDIEVRATAGVEGDETGQSQPAVFGGGQVRLIYTIDIPEPSTYAAVGFLALAGGAAMYRRRKLQNS